MQRLYLMGAVSAAFSGGESAVEMGEALQRVVDQVPKVRMRTQHRDALMFNLKAG